MNCLLSLLVVMMKSRRVHSFIVSNRSCYLTRTQFNLKALESSVSTERTSIDAFNPLGPPSALSKLSIGKTLSLSSNVITRLSEAPNIFHVANFVSSEEREVLMSTASSQGMKTAGTRNSDANTIRKHSYLTWLGKTFQNPT